MFPPRMRGSVQKECIENRKKEDKMYKSYTYGAVSVKEIPEKLLVFYGKI